MGLLCLLQSYSVRNLAHVLSLMVHLQMGKLRVHKSGKVKLHLGDVAFDMMRGIACEVCSAHCHLTKLIKSACRVTFKHHSLHVLRVVSVQPHSLPLVIM
jgi:RNA polymerase III RPC4